MDLEGRNINAHPLATHGVPVKRFRKSPEVLGVDFVLAAYATDFGMVETVAGQQFFGPGDYIVTDDPPTTAWPVPGAEFEDTYKEV